MYAKYYLYDFWQMWNLCSQEIDSPECSRFVFCDLVLFPQNPLIFLFAGDLFVLRQFGVHLLGHSSLPLHSDFVLQ